METNPKFLAYLLDETEAAMWVRLRELDGLGPNLNGNFERQEIAEVTVKMLALRTARLGWPGLLNAH